ncbi:hypothetical protein MMA231_00042 [Asticcacaulis sp. MM231]
MPTELQAEALGVGAATDGDQHHIGGQFFLRTAGGGFQRQFNAFRAGLGGRHLGAELEGEALLGQDLLEGGGGFGVHARRDAVKEFDHGHLRTQTTPDGAEFEADDAGADDDHRLRHGGQRQGAGGIDDLLLVDINAWQRGRFGAGGNDNVLGGERLHGAVIAGHGDFSGAGDSAAADEIGHFVLLHQELDPLGQGGDAVLLGLHHLYEVELGRGNFNADIGELMTSGLEQFRSVE